MAVDVYHVKAMTMAAQVAEQVWRAYGRALPPGAVHSRIATSERQVVEGCCAAFTVQAADLHRQSVRRQ